MNWYILWHQALIHAKFGLLQTQKGNTISFSITANQDDSAMRFKFETLGQKRISIDGLSVWHQGKGYRVSHNGI